MNPSSSKILIKLCTKEFIQMSFKSLSCEYLFIKDWRIAFAMKLNDYKIPFSIYNFWRYVHNIFNVYTLIQLLYIEIFTCYNNETSKTTYTFVTFFISIVFKNLFLLYIVFIVIVHLFVSFWYRWTLFIFVFHIIYILSSFMNFESRLFGSAHVADTKSRGKMDKRNFPNTCFH